MNPMSQSPAQFLLGCFMSWPQFKETAVTSWNPHWQFLKKSGRWETQYPPPVCSRSRYDGCRPVPILSTSVAITKRILAQIGSQCDSLRTGLRWFRRRAPVTIRTRQPWTRCNLSRFEPDVPAKTFSLSWQLNTTKCSTDIEQNFDMKTIWNFCNKYETTII